MPPSEQTASMIPKKTNKAFIKKREIYVLRFSERAKLIPLFWIPKDYNIRERVGFCTSQIRQAQNNIES